ncbi:indole-3-glycerol phosphate synthase TrpC [Candidatus Omnitrophota bacterium]
MKQSDTLKDIIAKKKERLRQAKEHLPEEVLKTKIENLPPARSLTKAINRPRSISLIAEIKRQSPSKGVIRQDFNPREIALAYQDCGVGAISVLTEEDYFAGSIAYINEVKNAVKLPVLRKDFIFEEYQVYESRFFGADAILLIAELLSKERLSQLIKLAQGLGLECLVEAHTEKELKKALSLKTDLIGINNRDLHTLEVDPKTTEKLFLFIPKDKVVVVESGMKSYQDILFLKILGVSAVLIGEAFMQAVDIRAKVREVMGC